MTSKDMGQDTEQNKASLSEITVADHKAVAEFLHDNMNSSFSVDKWEKGISVNWLDAAPNQGFKLTHAEKIVGVLCAIYSEQHIEGSLVKVCNPHSWCVLPEHRARSVDLVLSVIRQKGFHFTMFSPNKDGVEIFGYLKFKPLDNTVSIMLNAPTVFFSGIKIINKSDEAVEVLPGAAKKSYQDHLPIPWLNFLVFGKDHRFGFIIYKKQTLKKLPCAMILYISDDKLFDECWSAIRTNLFIKYGYVTSKIEQRLLSRPLRFTLKNEPGGRKFFLSDNLHENKIKYIYSELMALDI